MVVVVEMEDVEEVEMEGDGGDVQGCEEVEKETEKEEGDGDGV